MHQSVDREIARLLKRGVAHEERLLKRERKAESRVGAVQALVSREEARLARAQSRLDKQRDELANARSELDQRRAERSSGDLAPGGD